jgi:hypothetical protein
MLNVRSVNPAIIADANFVLSLATSTSVVFFIICRYTINCTTSMKLTGRCIFLGNRHIAFLSIHQASYHMSDWELKSLLRWCRTGRCSSRLSTTPVALRGAEIWKVCTGIRDAAHFYLLLYNISLLPVRRMRFQRDLAALKSRMGSSR